MFATLDISIAQVIIGAVFLLALLGYICLVVATIFRYRKNKGE